MIHMQNTKKVLVITQSSTTNAGTATGNIDRLSFDYCSIDVQLPTSDAVTNNPSVLKVSQSDTTDATNFSDIVGFRGDTDFTIPNCVSAATQVTSMFATLNVDCRALKRYLKVSISPLTTQVINVYANLSRAREMPNSTTEMNSLVVVNG